jgi:hypothetical protein
MNETQKTIGDWARETFPGGDDLSPRHCIRLLEEVVELCLAAGATYRECTAGVAKNFIPGMDVSARNPEVPEKVAAEMADCEIVLRVLAERRGVDLQAGVDLKMKINRARSWKSNGDGIGYHVKPPAA